VIKTLAEYAEMPDEFSAEAAANQRTTGCNNE